MDDPIMQLLLLADGRFPAGGHVHSFGVESAVADGRIRDMATLGTFLRARLRTVGLTEAALAASAVRLPVEAVDGRECWRRTVRDLDGEAQARQPIAPLRESSRRLGRQLIRVSLRCWPRSSLTTVPVEFPDGLHQPVALGLVVQAAGGSPLMAARLSLHHAATAPVQAAVRLLGLDPFAAAALVVGLGADMESTARRADHSSTGPMALLPASSGVAVDIAAAHHPDLAVRMFAT